MMTRVLSTAFLLACVVSLLGAKADDDFAKTIEETHGIDAYRSKSVLRADLTVTFGGGTPIDGTLYFDIDAERVRIEQKDGTTLVWDGANAWISPANVEFPMARFHLRTWSYFLAAPFKLRDPGAHLASRDPMPLMNGVKHDTAKLTFGRNVGDAPDDWYVVYRDDQHRLAAMSYIVTYGTSAEQAEKEPHAIVYNGYKTIDGVILSTEWSFYDWSAERGVYGEAIGHARLSGIRFLDENEATFAKPANATRDILPGE